MNLLLLAATSSLRYNLATGGTITEYTAGGVTYRLHSFETAGMFTFTLQNYVHPLHVCYVGGGGGGGATDGVYAGGGGDGGYGGDVTSLVVAPGDYSIVVGAGSTGTGGTTTAFGYSGAGGVGGDDGYFFNRAAGTTRGPTSLIEDGVTTLQYGIGGQEGSPPASSYIPNNGHGKDGSYGGGGPLGRVGSFPGAVWIRYRISG